MSSSCHFTFIGEKLTFLDSKNSKQNAFQLLHSTMTYLTLESLPQQSTFAKACPIPRSISPCNVSSITTQDIQDRKEFAIFLKILVNHLSQTDTAMRLKAKQLVRYCTKKNRDGDVKYSDLVAALSLRLRFLVGEQNWRHCQLLKNCVILASTSKSTSSLRKVSA